MKSDFQSGPGKTVRFAYAAVEPFGPSDGARWTSYVDWSRLNQLHRLVSADKMLCLSLVDLDGDEDWDHSIWDHYNLPLYWDLDHLRRRVPPGAACQLLAVHLNPSEDPAQ